MSSLFNIGLTSLFASQYALMLTNENIANAENPSYSRRTVDFNEVGGPGFGNGVQLTNYRRVMDNIANKNLVHCNSLYAAADAYATALKSFEPQLDSSGNSISTYIQQSLNQLNNLNASASNIQARNAYLYQLDSLADRFNQASQQISTEKQNMMKMVTDDVGQLNQIIQQIAQLNIQIAASNTSSVESQDLSLLDARDSLLNNMAEYINFDSDTDDRGMVNVKLTNGISLIFGGTASTLAAKPSASKPASLDVVISNGGTQEIITSFITSGKIAGLMSFQHDGLEIAERGLNRLALAISGEINAQSKLGMDLNGYLGKNIFNDINDPIIAAQRVIASSKNTGAGILSVDIVDVSQLTTSEYRITFDSASHYQVIRDSDSAVVASGSVPSGVIVDGYQINLMSTNFQIGDSFIVSPTSGAASALHLAITDPRQLALAFPVAAAASEANSGNGVINITSIIDTTTPDFATPGQLTPPLEVKFISPTQFMFINAQNGSQIGALVDYDSQLGATLFPTAEGYDPGYRVSLSGDMAAGDQFTIAYNVSSANDNRNGQSLSSLYQKGVLDGGLLNFVQGYHAVSSEISSKTNVANMMLSTQSILKAQAELRRDQISGVSLEEEIANVARFQQTYQASARILESVSTMFDVLLSLGRG